jgi:hypothetical protein
MSLVLPTCALSLESLCGASGVKTTYLTSRGAMCYGQHGMVTGIRPTALLSLWLMIAMGKKGRNCTEPESVPFAALR